jgi:hypothetical protein
VAHRVAGNSQFNRPKRRYNRNGKCADRATGAAIVGVLAVQYRLQHLSLPTHSAEHYDRDDGEDSKDGIAKLSQNRICLTRPDGS